ncbi:ScaI family restriction endonuclease [Pedobacter sp. SL55]|uniref:ScaI family restriction endonuclease n=1 Tax=Pedobacter sp. SL55 TaxID=2995161 RepID=UPI00226D7D09|nr:ScaI family restriction endonuclease [Pedobacter sp. SL55]WAC42343.1 ScaI family restriction endonuclease [Pedobacter sp. SL55]
MRSPYFNVPTEGHLKVTNKLIEDHPLKKMEIVDAVLKSWEQIFVSKIGPLSIGIDIFPSPQVMSNILHELIPYNLAALVGNDVRIGKSKNEKDIEYLPNPDFSIEVKTSSHNTDIFANRSYAQPSFNSGTKNKNGYYIAVNIEKFDLDEDGIEIKAKFDEKGSLVYPKIRKIRFGYLEHNDWIAQNAATGQQARLTPAAKRTKLLQIYP